MEGQAAEPLRHPGNPGEVLNRIIANEILGDNMDTPALLRDVQLLVHLGANGPKTSGYLKSVGNYRQVRSAILDEANKADAIKDGPKVLENIKLAQVFGMDKLPKTWAYFSYLQNEYGEKVKQKKKSKPRGLKRKVVLATGAGLIAAASIAGTGSHDATGKFLGQLLKAQQTTTQEGSEAESEAKPAVTPEATATLPPTPIPTKTPTPPATATSTPPPTATATATATPTKTPEPTPTPEVKTFKKDIFREFFAPKIYQEVLKLREQRDKKDREYKTRINQQLNQDRINFLVLGGRAADTLSDSILIFSYHLPSYSLSMLSVDRDLGTPEVYKRTGIPGSARINQAYGFGGMEFTKAILESATGLSMDLAWKMDFEAFINLIDETVGYVEVDVENDISDRDYPAMTGEDYDPFFIKAGHYKVDGKTALKLSRSRHFAKGEAINDDYIRAGRQRAIALAFFERLQQEGKKNFSTLGKFRQVLDREIKKKNIKPDFDLGIILPAMIGPIPLGLAPDLPSLLWTERFGEGWTIGGMPRESSIGFTRDNLIESAGIAGISIDRIKGHNYVTENPKDYWKPARKLTEEFLEKSKHVDTVPLEEEIEITLPAREETPPSSQRFPQTGEVVNVELKTAPFENIRIGESVERLPIEAVKFGSGKVALTLIGGLHTDDEENTRLLAEELIEYFKKNPQDIPPQISLYMIPAANPDGSSKKSHFNAHRVDLNRNWPTKDWQPQAVHPPHGVVSGGNQPLSEPETKALYEFLRKLNPNFVISLHSQASIVESNHVGQADTLAGIYAKYSGYKAIAKWPYYEVRGQFIDAMADLGIAAADVELSNHKDTDFERNLKALKAVMEAASQTSI